jgi:hypothetical protein
MRARLARVLLLVVLLAGWQAALEHPIQHGSHEASLLCDVLDALGACAPASQGALAAHRPEHDSPELPVVAPRLADAPPFHAQGPPACA